MALERETCDAVQAALVERAEPEPWILAHASSCPECAFFKDLSRELSASGALSDADTGLWPFETVLAGARTTGTPLLRRYHVGEPLGSGGQGVVSRALDTETGEDVALKLVRCPPRRAGATASEVFHAHLVRHLGICRVYHTERHGDVRLIVMELIEGQPLDAATAGLDRLQRLAVFRRLCEAVAAAHDAGVLHLDLKPSNVLVRPSGEPVVTDFGLSERLAGGPVRARGGTRRYMAPEQALGAAVDARSDVYALGVLLGELLPGASGRVKRAIERATAESPGLRFPDVRSFARELEGPGQRRRRGLLLAGATIVVAGLLWLPEPAAPRADVFVVGGQGPDGTWTATAEVFDSAAWRWRDAGRLPDRGLPRSCELRAVRSGDDVLVLGGGGATGCADDGATTNRVRLFSISSGTWSAPECQAPCVEHEGSTFWLDRSERERRQRWKQGPCRAEGPCMQFGRNSFVALPLGNEEVFAHAGCAGACTGPNELDQLEYRTTTLPVGLQAAELYQRATGRWTPRPASLRRRSRPKAVALGPLVLVCGRDSEDEGTCEMFDKNASRDAWQPAGRLPGGVADVVMVHVRGHSVLGLQRGHAWLWGDKSLWGHELDWRWEGSFFQPLPLPARGQHGGELTRLRDGRVLLTGGFESDQVVATAQVFTLAPSGAGGDWRPVAPMRRARLNHAAVLLEDGRVLAAGGCGPEALSSAEAYDPARDRWVDAGRLSTPRCRPQAVATW